MKRDVFRAIADPVRREIIDLLVQEERTVNAIAEEFEISRPAISRHLKILNECGLVNFRQEGRERYCCIKADELIPAFLWLEQFKQLWEIRIDSFEDYLKQLQSKK